MLLCCEVISSFVIFAVLRAFTGPVRASSKCTSSSVDIHIILHLPAEFCPNRTIRDRLMTLYLFSRRRPRHRNSTSGFGFRDFAQMRRLTSICIEKFRRDISIIGWDITTSGFWKQTSAMLEFYFGSWLLRLRHHQHDNILHLSTKFRPNLTIRDRVMTLYPF